jgi:primosomal protein N' (replication factor Y)
MDGSLFPEVALDEPAEPARADGPFAGVAIEQSVDKVLDYSIPARLKPLVQVGQRVRVPLGRGNKIVDGYVVSIHPTSSHPKLKPLNAIADERVLVAPKMMELARWISRYYCTPLGAVLESVIPSAVKKRIGLGYVTMIRLAVPREQIQELLERTRGAKRRAVLARLLQIAPDQAVPIEPLASEAGVKVPTVRKLAASGLISIFTEPDLAALGADMEASAADEKPIRLNDEQQHAFDALKQKLGSGFSVSLLFGVTGSGKTEVYLQCIAESVKAGKQAIVLVPEIALTPQTVRRFTRRFPHVAVLHSGLSASQRHRYWQQISRGQAQVVVGARSAIFAPVPNLGVIVIDEEHEASYKQDQAPRYHGRDVAIKRAQLEAVPIILGSATPSLEMWHRCAPRVGETPNPTYALLTLQKRAKSQPLPAVEIVDLKQVARERKGIHLISPRLEYLLKNTIALEQQAILLLNRRGYSNFVYCGSCGEAVQCQYCDTTMTYHRSAGAPSDARTAQSVHTGQLHCHYCLAVQPLPQKCPACGKMLSLFGLGTQRVEEEMERKFPGVRYARVDSDSMHSSRDYEQTLDRFARGEIDVMLGTQMIAKGLDYPNVTLVGVISGDTALALPDFRASERTFQLITQVAGRAGRGDKLGRVVLQTFQPDQPTIVAALKQDFVGFAERELQSRREVGLPPFTRMVRVVLRDDEEEKVHHRTEELAAKLAEAIVATETAGAADVQMKGPMPCPISRIAGYWRDQVVLVSRSAPRLQAILALVREQGLLAAGDRIAVDVDPVSLL